MKAVKRDGASMGIAMGDFGDFAGLEEGINSGSQDDFEMVVESPAEMGNPAGFALFVFRDGNWVIQEDFSKPGFRAVPPSIAGSFDGQVLRSESALPTSN